VTSETAVDGLVLAPLPAPPEKKRKLPILSVDAMLEAQRTLSAVDCFSKARDSSVASATTSFYRDLIPLDRPKLGEQYAFEVDLDRCTGCKACVTACHTLNGLDEGEVWRSVGLLHGGTSDAPAQQNVTTACHHCVEPACMHGCPTRAYEKDPITGIVKHLDDQCFGCQYCTLMCPYDAPKYNASRGIVRKCDMCSDRLLRGEAPPCVQACPSGAIAIRVVEQAAIVQRSDARQFLPGAPAPDHTIPATRYQTRRGMPDNMLPADFYTTRAEHSHPSLVVMLILTQLSAGAFGLAWFGEQAFGWRAGTALTQALLATAVAIVAMVASVFHLGRPWLAYRGVLGWRTSWLSREAIAFALFAALVMGWGALSAATLLPDFRYLLPLGAIAHAVRLAAVVAGALGVFCSVMVYVVTRREQWSAIRTGIGFFGTTLLLGGAAVLIAAHAYPVSGTPSPVRPLLWLIVMIAGVKMVLESAALLRSRDRQTSAHKRMAKVMLGELALATTARFCLLALGGVVMPLALATVLLTEHAARALSMVMFVVLFASEFVERHLFFRAAPPSRMPGALK